MTLNIVLLAFIMVVFLAYTLGIYFAFGVTTSISSSIHKLQGTKKSLYSWFMIGIAIPFMIVSDTPLGWWAGAFLAIDFAAPTGGDKLNHTLHCIGADVGMGLGVAMLWIVWGMWWLTVPAIVIVALLYILGNYKIKGKIWVKNETWWIEWFVYAVVMVGMFIERVI